MRSDDWQERHEGVVGLMRRLLPLFMGILLSGVVASAAQGQTRGGFDDKGRLLMHGTPRFMLGVFDSGGGYSTLPSHWEEQIFSPTGPRGLQDFPLNLYLNYWLGGMPIAPTTALLDVLHDHGMMYLQTGNCFDTGSWMRDLPAPFSITSQSYVQQYAQHPAALGYYIMDECDDSLIAETEAHHDQLKSWDPQGITFATTVAAGYRDPSLWTDAADVLGTDPYPLYGPERAPGYTHFIVADFVSKLRAVARPNRPIWSVLQFFKFTTDSRMPTPEELRTHAVMSIVEGAQGIFWWDIGVNGLRRLDAATVSTYMSHLKTLTTELAGLEPALIADEANAALVGNSTKFADPMAGRIEQLRHNIEVEWLFSREDLFSRRQWYQEELTALLAGDPSKSGGLLDGAANVRTLTKVINGVGYVFAYNYTNTPRPVTFTWHSAPTRVQEPKTGQTFPLSGASWNDTFGPYQARIYLIQDAGAPPPPPPGSLGQFENDGVLTVPVGGTVDAKTVVLKGAVADPDGDTVKLQVEVRPLGAGFTNTVTHESSLVAGGSQANVMVSGLTNGSSYHWQARTVDSEGATSGWVAFAANPESAADFTVSVVSFVDVRSSDSFWLWIEALVQAGMTGGCGTSPPAYCPDQSVSRAQMAVFLLRGIHGADYTPPAASGIFADVPPDHPFAAWIEQLFAEEITSGCGTKPLRYCPDQGVTRGPLAVFLLRSNHGPGYQPPVARGIFADVPLGHPFARWIEQLFVEAITGGCGTDPARYCPDQSVTRGQMAVFLVRTFGLPM
jgi:hypothetical protein